MWQEWLFTLGAIIFTVSLLPACFDRGTAMPLKSGLPTGLILAAYSVAFWSLGLTYSSITTATTAAAWLFIAAKRRL